LTVGDYREIELRRDARVAWITFNRPQRLNAFNDRLLDELDSALDAERDSESRVLVLRGAGRAFSAGFDISSDAEEIAPDFDAVDLRDRQAEHAERWLRIWDHPKPVIAAVHGFCMAGATQMCVFCDLTVVAEDAVIAASPALPLGGGFISPMWSFLVGPKRAKQMSFVAGERISGATAAEWGWANYAVPAERLEEEVGELARRIARTPSSMLRMKKLSNNRALELQGFRTMATMGAETNTIVHETDAVRGFQGSIREHGLKEAIRRFEAAEE
jgi:enoyl-CoA hydratase/carnithine racemase